MPSSNGIFGIPSIAASGIHEMAVTEDSTRIAPSLFRPDDCKPSGITRHLAVPAQGLTVHGVPCNASRHGAACSRDADPPACLASDEGGIRTDDRGRCAGLPMTGGPRKLARS